MAGSYLIRALADIKKIISKEIKTIPSEWTVNSERESLVWYRHLAFWNVDRCNSKQKIYLISGRCNMSETKFEPSQPNLQFSVAKPIKVFTFKKILFQIFVEGDDVRKLELCIAQEHFSEEESND